MSVTNFGSTLLCTVKSITNTQALEKAHVLKSKIDPIVKSNDLDVKHAGEHQFEPHGASIFFVLGSSHLAIHTWPEHSALTLDIHLCSGEGFNLSCKLALEIASALGGKITKQNAISH